MNWFIPVDFICCQDFIMATGDSTGRKHSTPGARFQMEFNIEDIGSKQEFQDRIEHKLVPGKTLKYRQFLLTLLEKTES